MNIPSLQTIKESLQGPKAGMGALILAIGTFLYPQTPIPQAPVSEQEYKRVIGQEEEVLANGQTLITTMEVVDKLTDSPQVADIQQKAEVAEGAINQLREVISAFLIQAAEKPLGTVFAVVVFIWLRITVPPAKVPKPEPKAEESKN